MFDPPVVISLLRKRRHWRSMLVANELMLIATKNGTSGYPHAMQTP